MNMFQKWVYFFLELQEKMLVRRLSKHLKKSARNSTSKTVYSTSATLTLNAETKKNIELVKQNVTDIVKNCEGDILKLLSYVESKGTRVVKLDNADKLLSVIREEEGLVTSLEGLDGLYINIITNSGFSFKSKPMFIMREGDVDPYYLVHQFYKWYSLEMGLPGYDYMSQKLFKIYLNSNADFANLNLDEMIGLKEAVSRDKEATEFALSLAKYKEGSKKVLEKMQGDGANV